MACSNCYNGCTEIVSDRCVRYTGLDVALLGIRNGDSLSFVEAALIEFLTSTINGVGIKPIIAPTVICNLVQQYLPDCGELTLNDILKALIEAACDLQEQVDLIVADIATLNADYDVDCLTGVTSTSDTHAVLQAVITKLCELDVDLAALALDVDTNYVKLADLNSLIAAYIASTTTSSTRYFNRMIPYTAIEYYGPLTGNFDVTGAGIVGTDWEKIYLCNGLNGTPDKRGRVPVGAIVGVGGGAMNSAVDPATPTNPNYALNGTTGANTVTLSTSEIPAHTHVASVTDPGHRHFVLANDNATAIPFTAGPTPTAPVSSYVDLDGNFSYQTGTSALLDATIGRSSSSATGVTVTNANAGTGGAHANIQPVLACYYIMYIP
jgi:microcystin-dependent protein